MTATQDQLKDEFLSLPNWEARYQKLIAMGRALPALPEAAHVDDNKVRGCQSQVWLTARLDHGSDGPFVHFEADSDALLVKGLIALVLAIYNDQPPSAILSIEPEVLNQIGLSEHLSMQRNNGLAAVIKQIKFYALAFQALC
ncbi:MAG: SufE family protein [Vampirovibrionales bacterium]|nr:SufE family protein [Vampirovibrionales bacterium]